MRPWAHRYLFRSELQFGHWPQMLSDPREKKGRDSEDGEDSAIKDV